MRVGRCSFLLLVVASAATSAQQSDTARASARDSVRTFDPMIVTAARRDEHRRDAVVSTAVVTRADIRDAAATNVAAVLVQQLGLQAAAGSPAGAQVLMQGLGDQRVLVLLDGQPLAGRIGGAFDLSRLPTSIVERIEIVKGPQSVLYGTDAMGGVINIVTRAPGSGALGRRVLPEASVTAGSHDRLDLSTRVGGALGDVAYALDLGREHVALAPGVSSNAGAYANRWNAAPRLHWRASPSLSLDAAGFGVLEQQRYRGGQLFNFSDNTQADGRMSATWTSGAARLTPSLAYSSFDHLSRAATSPSPASDSGAHDTQRLLTAALNYSGLLGGLMIDAGSEYRHESIVADRVPGERLTDAGALYAQTTWVTERASIAPGARASWSEQWGASVTPRLAAMVRPFGAADPLTLRASVSGGFRSPDFKELYLRFVNSTAGYAINGNDALRPEHSVNTTLEAEWAAAATELRVSVYHNRIRDLIETVGPDADGTYTYDNVGRATTAGGELEIARRWARGEVDLGYAYLRARDLSSGGPILGRAAHSARATLRGTLWSEFRLAVTGLYTGAAPSARDELGAVSATRRELTQFNVRLGRRVGVTEVFLGADDVFDARRDFDWPGFTGRQLSVGLFWPAR